MKYFLHISFGIIIFLFVHFTVKAAPFEGRDIVISGASPEAVQTAKKIYAKGGNVVDAAVAMTLSMGVTNPYFSALGGGGFALVKMDGKIKALDFREVGPKAINENSFKEAGEKSSITGGLAVGVPGIPKGLWELHKTYGKLSWQELFDDAIDLSKNGFQLSGNYVERLNRNWDRFNKAGKSLFGDDLKKIKPGQNFKQLKLAKALSFLRHKGVKEFYEGRIAKDLIASVKKAGGKITAEDLKNYEVKWREPLEAEYKGFKIHMMPPPSSGGVIIKTALYLMEKWELDNYQAYSTQEIHLLGEILSRSYRSRALLADPEYFENPLGKILDQKYLDRLVSSISSYKTLKLDPLDEKDYIPQESTETTHLSILDKNGNAVSMTVTLNGSFGSGIFTEKYGINLNNEMDDFTTRPGEPNMFGLVQGSMNQAEAGKRPLSSMTPTIVENKDKSTRLVLGSPGGPRIISSILQVMYRNLVSGYDIDEAIQAPRFHHQFLPHKLYYEKNKVFPELIKDLKKKGHDLEESWAGRVYGATKEGEVLKAAFDSRLPGAANGY
ncbi:MAG: gamma-glutamyltransferase [Bdellovibrionota bacterium]